MPKHFKTLSAYDVIRIFTGYGFVIFSQKGSHVKLRRFKGNDKQTLIVPNHKELDTGTIGAIYRQALRYISSTELENDFCIHE